MHHVAQVLRTSNFNVKAVPSVWRKSKKRYSISVIYKIKKRKKPITLTETSPGSDCKTGRRDFIYVGDVADAFIANCESEKTGKGEIINIATGRMTSMQEVAETIGGEVKFIPKRGFEVESHQADLSQCNRLLN